MITRGGIVTPEEALQREGLALPAPHPVVANYVMTVRVKLFGHNGRPARSAVGVTSLPLGLCEEIEAVMEVRDG